MQQLPHLQDEDDAVPSATCACVSDFEAEGGSEPRRYVNGLIPAQTNRRNQHSVFDIT